MRLFEFCLAAWTVCWKANLHFKQSVTHCIFQPIPGFIIVTVGWLCMVCKIAVFSYSLNRVVNSRPHCMKMVLSEGPVEPSSSSPSSGSTHAGPHLGTRRRSRRHRLTKWWDEDYSLPPDVIPVLLSNHAGTVQRDAFASLLWKVQLETRYFVYMMLYRMVSNIQSLTCNLHSSHSIK